ncbi:4Fe-4S binding protein [Marispirochaeta sp.]|uniref:4Fe-4S binding protein n=1 Tax=Marispirochaeta sp. TaxID=2038653 RepID=UPI0029C81345|nr:4Fe-4S binding protein [Marispirochaeta sp.]
MKKKILTPLRLAVLALFVIFITYEAYMHQVKGGGPDGAASIHALCPYGGLESLFAVFTAGSMIDKIYAGTFVLFGVTIVLVIVFRRAFCGWICPFGGIQEFLGRLGKKLMGRQLVMPGKADRVLRYLKYPVLVLTVLAALKTATLWMSPYDPWAAYGHITEGFAALWSESAVGLILLIITVVGSFLYDRFFCKYLCPMGGFLGIVSKVSPFKIKRVESVCISCDLCTKACSMNIDVAAADTITDAECINCQECVAACPKKGALENRFSFKRIFRVTPVKVGLIVLLIYFGGIGVSALAGWYTLLPAPITSETTVANVDELKGYMTLTEISTLTGMSLDEVYRRMDIPENVPSSTPVKELSSVVPGFEFHSARDKLKD